MAWVMGQTIAGSNSLSCSQIVIVKKICGTLHHHFALPSTAVCLLVSRRGHPIYATAPLSLCSQASPALWSPPGKRVHKEASRFLACAHFGPCSVPRSHSVIAMVIVMLTVQHNWRLSFEQLFHLQTAELQHEPGFVPAGALRTAWM